MKQLNFLFLVTKSNYNDGPGQKWLNASVFLCIVLSVDIPHNSRSFRLLDYVSPFDHYASIFTYLDSKKYGLGSFLLLL